MTLESDKAAMDVPSPADGVIGELRVKVGDKVCQGTVILTLAAVGRRRGQGAGRERRQSDPPEASEPAASGAAKPPPAEPASSKLADFSGVNAGPAVRRLARELGLDLTQLNGTGEKGRITKDDLKAALGGSGSARPATGGAGLPDVPTVDFAKFGPIETKPLSRIKKISGPRLHASWVNIPACHPHRRGRRHGTRGVPQIARRRGQGRQEGALSRLAAAAADEGERRDAEDLSDLQLGAEPRQGRADPSPLLEHRRRRRHARRPRRRGRQRRRQEGRRRAVARARRALRQGARRQAQPQRNAGRDLHHLLARRHRRHGFHADRQRAGSGDPRRRALEDGAGVGRQGVPAAPDAAALPLLRSPRDRRRRGGALHAPSRAASPRTCGASCSEPLSEQGSVHGERNPAARHRRLQGRADHRDPRQTRAERRQGRDSADAGERQGDARGAGARRPA